VKKWLVFTHLSFHDIPAPPLFGLDKEGVRFVSLLSYTYVEVVLLCKGPFLFSSFIHESIHLLITLLLLNESNISFTSKSIKASRGKRWVLLQPGSGLSINRRPLVLFPSGNQSQAQGQNKGNKKLYAQLFSQTFFLSLETLFSRFTFFLIFSSF
jgi:hypothetical protein